MIRPRLVAAAVFVAFATVACGGGKEATKPTSASAMVGVFKITQGSCSASGTKSGSFFRMVQPRGTPAKGPFVKNGDSSCPDKTFTALSPGTDGGLATGRYQSHPAKAFDASGNGAAGNLTKPTKWFAVAFSLTTNATDPQTKMKVPAPVIRRTGNKLSGDLRAFAAAWNGQHFNQGAPKPNGSSPGNTKLPTGTYDAATGSYQLEWASQIVSGPFNNFTGIWHLEGTFAPTR